jgi:hypothetical protein
VRQDKHAEWLCEVKGGLYQLLAERTGSYLVVSTMYVLCSLEQLRRIVVVAEQVG